MPSWHHSSQEHDEPNADHQRQDDVKDEVATVVCAGAAIE